jgi:hypothetical protein
VNKQDIINALKLLGEELEALHIVHPVRVLLIGGGYMLTQIGNRTFTEDVDVYTSFLMNSYKPTYCCNMLHKIESLPVQELRQIW